MARVKGTAVGRTESLAEMIEARLAAAQLSFIAEIDRLKTVYRASPLAAAARRENDAEHSWHLAMMAVGDSFDNAMAESVIGLYKNECVKIDGPFMTVDELELATSSWVHWFNEHRLHSSIGYVLPIEYERPTTIETPPRSNRCRENSPSTKHGAVQFTLW